MWFSSCLGEGGTLHDMEPGPGSKIVLLYYYSFFLCFNLIVKKKVFGSFLVVSL